MTEIANTGDGAENPTLVSELLEVYNAHVRDNNETMEQLAILGHVANIESHPGYKYKLGEVSKVRSLLSDIGGVLIRHTAEPFDEELEKLLTNDSPE